MNRRFNWIVLPSLLLGTSVYSYSEKVSLDEAKSLATEFVKSRTGSQSANVTLEPVYTAGTEKAPLYYIFNFSDNHGFVMVSAETSTTPVLGYSFQAAYPVQNTPDAMKWMLAGIEKEIKAAPSIQSSTTLEVRRKAARKAAERTGEEKVLNTAKWSQEGPFNAMIPGRPLVGCVGTAMATIMKYYEHPVAGAGSFGGVDFATTYDWSNMRMDNYRSGYTDAEADAVATLMYHASKSIDTQYAMSGSSAYEVRVPGALSTYFGYDPGVSYKKRAEVATQADWDAIVKNEIDNGRPVLYCGQDVTAGHAFVCDGYQGEYLHFNWGWGGSADGYFLSTALNPTVSRTHQYNNLNTIIYNIKPNASAVGEWSPIHITADGNQAGIGSDLTDLTSGKTFTVRVGNLKNIGNFDFNGKIAVALCDEKGKMKALLSSPANFSMISMGYLPTGYQDFRNCSLPAGTSVAATDRVRIMTQANGQNEWLPVAGELLTVNEINPNSATPASFMVTLPTVEGVTVEGASSVIRGWNYSFKVLPGNPAEDVVTVKANGVTLIANANTYTIENVRENQEISILVQKAADVKEKRSFWVGTAGTLSTIIPESETGTIKDLTLFGTLDARDFAFLKNSMNVNRLDISGVHIAAYGSDQANAIPRDAFRGKSALKEVILPNSVNRFNNACFALSGITSITIPASVSKYEYNIFVSCTALRDIYVGRENAEFINWCVLSGVKTNLVTLHVPSERAVSNYQKAENWNTIANIIVDKPEVKNEVLFAVMEDSEVKFETSAQTGKMEKGSSVSFKASHIADNDNNMTVYANATRLTPDADGNYNVNLADNTIIHFELTAPMTPDPNKSQWTLTDKNGSIGMVTDAVNVIPGSEFTIRLNALNIPKGYDQAYWGAVLTDKNGNIKEFISPVNVWSAGPGDNHKLNVTCKVNESNVREGNQIRIATSFNKRNWNLVKGASAEIVDALPALNNMTPVYNINVAEVKDATVSGVTSTAVRGRDMTLKITPNSPAYRVDLKVNGVEVLKNQAVVNYTFVAMEDMNFEADVYDPKIGGAVVYNVQPGELPGAVTSESVAANVVVVGEVYSKDLSNAFRQPFAANTIKKLDLSGVKIVANVLTPTSDDDKIDNFIPANLFYNPTAIGSVMPVVEEIILPNSVTRIDNGAFKNCSNIKEITLPTSLSAEKIVVGTYASGSPKYGYSLGYGMFEGCTSLTTITLPCAPSKVNGRDVVSFFNPYGSYANGVNSGLNVHDGSTKMYDLGFWKDGKPNASGITLIVPEEYLSVYKTAYSDMNNGNPWVAYGYNILSENPVYGITFDPTRVKADGVEVNKLASFLGDDVAVESKTVDVKLGLVNPQGKYKVYDNGNEIQPAEDGTIAVTFYNPAKKADLAGNHQIDVVYTHDVNFNSTSSHFAISVPAEENTSGTFDASNALNPVLRDVAENSDVRFKVDFTTEHANGLEARVMIGNEELTADEDGFYNVAIVNAGKNIDIFAVPTEGATLNAEDLAAIKPEEGHGITSISLEGEMTSDDFDQMKDCFPNLEELDLSNLTGDLPESAFAGMENLTTVVLPEVSEISANMFNGCSNLQSVDIPATVGSIAEGAFKDCSSLETLILTGVSSIGDGAFDGCDNMTTITLLSSSADPKSDARGKAKRKAGSLSSKAFKGLNPNCIVVLDEGVEVPSAEANYLHTAQVTLTETDAEGNEIEREGRAYSVKSDINFIQGYALAIPHTFTIEDGAVVSLEAETKDWTPIVVPFDVETITDETNNEIAVTLAEDDAEYVENNTIYTLLPEGEKLQSVDKIAANTPVFFYTSNSGKTIFATGKGSVAATPAEIRVEGKDFTLHASYKSQELPAADTYLLDGNCYYFTPENVDTDAEEPTVTVNPFELYATSPVKVNEILTGLPGVKEPLETGIENIEFDANGLKIVKEGNVLAVYSYTDRTVTIYSADGRAISKVNLKEGRNVVELPAAGIYIIADSKVIF